MWNLVISTFSKKIIFETRLFADRSFHCTSQGIVGRMIAPSYLIRLQKLCYKKSGAEKAVVMTHIIFYQFSSFSAFWVSNSKKMQIWPRILKKRKQKLGSALALFCETLVKMKNQIVNAISNTFCKPYYDYFCAWQNFVWISQKLCFQTFSLLPIFQLFSSVTFIPAPLKLKLQSLKELNSFQASLSVTSFEIHYWQN